MSGSLWGDLSSIEDFKNPLDLLKEQSGYLLNATNNVLFGDIRTRNPIAEWGEPNEDFATSFFIKSKVMENYEYEVFTIFYSIPFYPMYITVNESLANVIFGYSTNYCIDTNSEFINILSNVFGNEHTKNIIKSLYSMSK